MEFSVKQVADIIGGEIVGDESLKINTLSKIQEGKPGSISFLANPKYESFIYETNATAVIVSKDFVPKKEISTTLIKVDDSYTSFTKLLEFYEQFIVSQKVGIQEPSYIGEGSVTGSNIFRGAFSYIGTHCLIGDDVKIFPNAYIGDNVKIGNKSIIHPGARIMDNTHIGEGCLIQAGAVIGSDGFGYAPTEDGTYKNIPQLGGVVLEDFVHIGANTTIDKATMAGDATIIGKGSKLDNLIQIAHNVKIGENNVIAAQAGISGSTTIGNNNIFGGQVGMVGHITVGDKMIVGAKAGVSKSYPKGNEILLGSIGFNHKDYKRSYSVFKKLPDLSERVKKLEEKILNLPTV